MRIVFELPPRAADQLRAFQLRNRARTLDVAARALVERALAEEEAREGATFLEWPLAEFAARVKAAAALVPESGRYGDKVFIAAVREAMPERGTLDQFKGRLVEANRRGFLELERADLVEAMPRELVERSETRHLNAAFHFIRGGAR